MTVFESAVKAVSEMLGWMFWPDTWEFGKVILREDRTTVNISTSLTTDQVKVKDGQTKEEAEAIAIYNLLIQLPSILKMHENQILAEIAEQSSETDGEWKQLGGPEGMGGPD